MPHDRFQFDLGRESFGFVSDSRKPEADFCQRCIGFADQGRADFTVSFPELTPAQTMIISSHILEQNPRFRIGRLFKAPGLPTKPTFMVDREVRSCPPSGSRLHGRESFCLRNEALNSTDHLPKTILDGNSPTQLHIDFRTRRPTAIDFLCPTTDQRAACTALNRERTRGILEAAQLAPSRESFPVDVWNAIFARKSKQKGVPLIPLERPGIHHDEDGVLSSDFLVALPSGAEANPYRDDDWNVVYKFFFLGEGGSLGRKIALEEPENDRFEIQLLPARLIDTF